MLGCRPLSTVEVDQIKSKLGERDKLLFILGYRTGLRVTELLSLRRCDVYTKCGLVLPKVSIQRRNTKGKLTGRSVILHSEAVIALQSYLSSLPIDPNHPLFPSLKRANRPLTRVATWRILNRAVRECGLTGKVATHSMRKTFADRVYKALDKDLLKTKVALGHKSINSTISYLSYDQDEIDQVILAT